MILKLYGSPMSGCTRRVAMVLHEKQVPFELIPVDMKDKEHKSTAYLEKQRFGQVPYIDDDGFILFESRPICRYICQKYPSEGPALVPEYSDIKATAKYEEAASIEYCHWDVPIYAGLFQAHFCKNRGLEPNMEEAWRHLNVVDEKLDIFEKILSEQKFMAGNELTLVDLYYINFGSILPTVGSDMLTSDKRPSVARWWKEISSRSSWLAVKDGVKSTSEY